MPARDYGDLSRLALEAELDIGDAGGKFESTARGSA
jgi:hypothetical protein